jgi:hypothetical protein
MSCSAKFWASVLAAAVVAAPADSVLGEAMIVVGDHDLLQDTPNQQITFSVSGDELVTGVLIRQSIGDGFGGAPEPQFTGVDFSGTIWNAFPFTTVPHFMDSELAHDLTFDTAGDQVVANGTIVTVLIDTTGFFTGTFPLKLENTTFGESTSFILTGGGLLKPGPPNDFTITNGSINIVPEPALPAQLLALVGLGGLGLFFRKRKQRAG